MGLLKQMCQIKHTCVTFGTREYVRKSGSDFELSALRVQTSSRALAGITLEKKKIFQSRLFLEIDRIQ